MILLQNPIWNELYYLSASRVSSYFKCGHAFKLKYTFPYLKPPGSLKNHRGVAFHKAIEHDNKHFMVNDTRLPYDELISIANTKFDDCLRKGVFIPKRDIQKQDSLIEKARWEMEESVRLYYEIEKPWQPLWIEENRNIDVGYPLQVNLRIDLVDREHVIYDWKTTAKDVKYEPGIQDMLYCKAYEADTGIKPRFKFYKFILTKKTSRVEIQEMEVQNYDILDRYIEAYFHAIENNLFLPASTTDYMCSEGGCPFYLLCEYKERSK